MGGGTVLFAPSVAKANLSDPGSFFLYKDAGRLRVVLWFRMRLGGCLSLHDYADRRIMHTQQQQEPGGGWACDATQPSRPF